MISTGSLIISSPAFPLIAIAIKLESKGPVFYLQESVGQNNQRFNIYKFRTMHLPENRLNEDYPSVHDPDAVTKVGKFLRKYTVDELPQLVNVIQGHMAVVGPRPLPEKSIDFQNENFKRVLSIKPGLISTGSTLQRHSNYEMTNTEVAKINAEYEEQRTFIRDLVVLLKSIMALWKGR